MYFLPAKKNCNHSFHLGKKKRFSTNRQEYANPVNFQKFLFAIKSLGSESSRKLN